MGAGSGGASGAEDGGLVLRWVLVEAAHGRGMRGQLVTTRILAVRRLLVLQLTDSGI